MGQTIYTIFPTVQAASKWDLRRTSPVPLYFAPDSPGFRLTEGDPNNVRGLEFMVAWHEIFREEGPALTAHWLMQKTAEDAENAWLKANPPPVQDVQVRFWPSKGAFTDRATGKTHLPEAPSLDRASRILPRQR